MAQLSFEPIADGIRDRVIAAEEILAVKHAMPPTKVPHALLHENHSQDMHLLLQLKEIDRRKARRQLVYEQSERLFTEKTLNKHRKWRREDDLRLGGMNFPTVHQEGTESRPASVQLMYTSPMYTTGEEGLKRSGTALPYMTIRAERTEILQHQNATFITKLPTIAEIDIHKLQKHTQYCGSKMLQIGNSVTDPRFKRLQEALATSYTPKPETPRQKVEEENEKEPSKAKEETKDKSDNIKKRPESKYSYQLSERSDEYTPGQKICVPLGTPSSRQGRSVFPPVQRSTTTYNTTKPDTSSIQSLSIRKEKTDTEIVLNKSTHLKKSKQILHDLKTQNLRSLAQNYGLLSRSYGNLRKFRSRESVRTQDSAPCGSTQFNVSALKMFYTLK